MNRFEELAATGMTVSVFGVSYAVLAVVLYILL